MEVQHFRTIYHVFIASLCVFISSTLAIDFIDAGRQAPLLAGIGTQIRSDPLGPQGCICHWLEGARVPL